MKSSASESKNNSLSPEAEFSEKLTFRDYLIASEQKSNKPLPIWRLVVPLLIQTGLIMAVPAQALYTDMTGKTVILQTVPVNSNNVQQGNSLALDYNISRTANLRRLPGWETLVSKGRGSGRRLPDGTNIYVILQEQLFSGSGVPRAWRPVRVTGDRPTSIRANQAALKGVYQDGFVNYGLETYYIPENQRQQINNDIRQAQRTRRGQQPPIVVKAKVDPQGNAVPISMWVRDRNYRF
ncbi:GDYXXLXY domain-containing protein [aff. Roholtiella sp. LEGE 12411]|uniref:GDYXXLXY domain-containing protein n=1 Tax=aff. Roholtiella sp. LEGE 12411 TaxID=1828822 RepID=UPI0018812A44|nr:GDYXXLXY domain-containing protein [aff. Roholtiella sp. LEGE 12411]MBE9036832.1 GDYXXLXY domain-containing protein [aff. Roholtiella sp. LEGE 12411]